MNTNRMKKTIIKALPYVFMGFVCTNLGEAWRLAEGADASKKLLSFFSTLGPAFANPLPSFHPVDLLVGAICGGALWLAVYIRHKNAKHFKHNQEYAGKTAVQHRQRSVSLIIDIQKKCQEKGPGYQQWAKAHNVKQLARSVFLMRERGYRTVSELSARADDQIKKRDDLLASIKASEARMAEIATLKKHIINYSKTRKTYEEYRKAGYSKKFFEAHREEITLHKAAKQAFDDLGVKKIPKVKDLNTEYAELLAKKKAAYPEYRRIKEDAQELLIAKMNIESFYEADQKVSQEHQRQEKQH